MACQELDQRQMVPFSSFVTTSWTSGSPRLDRFNAIDAVNIQGSPAPGVSSGEAMQAIEEILQQMPHGYSIEWNGVSYQERVAGSNAAPLYALSVLVVFLALAALYESWTIPIAVILVVPTGVVGALGLTWICGKENDVYFQVGLLTTVGLVSKNAILIVEFARDLHDQGQELLASVVEAVRLRLRPILMTSLAFGLGVCLPAWPRAPARCTVGHWCGCFGRYDHGNVPMHLLCACVLRVGDPHFLGKEIPTGCRRRTEGRGVSGIKNEETNA